MGQTRVALVAADSSLRESRRQVLRDAGFDVVALFDRMEWLSLDGRMADDDDLLIVFDEIHRDQIERVGLLHRDYPKAHFVLLSDTFELDAVVEAFRHGVDGCIVVPDSPEPMIAWLQLAAMGHKIMPSEVAEVLFDRQDDHAVEEDHMRIEDARLSTREMQIVGYLIQGATNKTISRALNIAEATVKVHVKAVLRKLHLHNRTQAAIWGIASGIGHLDDARPSHTGAAVPPQR